VLDSYESALQGSEVIMCGGLCLSQALCMAEKLRVPLVPMLLGPTLATSEFPLFLLSFLTLGLSCLNKWTYTVAFSALWGQEKAHINPWRSRLGLPPITEAHGTGGVLLRLRCPVLIACSSLMCGPKCAVPADYPPQALLAGFVFVPATEPGSVAQPLQDFMQVGAGDGRPVLYLGFGSMPAPNPAALLSLALELCRLCRARAVLVAGWSELSSNKESAAALAEAAASNTLLLLRSAPHDWLLPQCSLIVHHAGVGTCAAALRSGVPQLPCPFMLDQPHNSQTLVRLGVAPRAVPYDTSMTAAKLAEAAKLALAPGSSFAAAAQRCAEVLRQEAVHSKELYCKAVEQAPSPW
jgi:sterol 3beta-glucosyltransferase